MVTSAVTQADKAFGGALLQYKADFAPEFCGARSHAESRALNPGLLTFPAWLAKHKSRIPLG